MRRVCNRHYLVVLAVHEHHGHIYQFEVLCEVGFGEDLDAIVVSLSAAHHSLTPPVADHSVRDLRARTVEAVEGPTGRIEIKLRPISRKRRPIAVRQYLTRGAAGVAVALDHDGRNGADQHSLATRSLP